MSKYLVIFTLFATVWQGCFAADWGTRLAAEQQWLIESLTPPEETVIIEEDVISTGQAAPVRGEAPAANFQVTNPWDPAQGSVEEYNPTRKRSR